MDLVPSLSPAARAALVDLERRTVAADGGRLKLELRSLDALTGRDPRLALRWDESRLIGFAGIYAFGNTRTAEIAGAVDPAARRQGIGSALLDAVLSVCERSGFTRALLVTPRNDAGGREFAAGRGAVLDHSEHAMMLPGPPADGPTNPALTVRPAAADDIPAIASIMSATFDFVPDDVADRLHQPTDRTYVVDLAGEVVATARLAFADEVGSIYGFAVAPDQQGRGIGRDVLRRCCRTLRDQGASRVTLEVEVDNDRALGLYTSVGFQRVLTEDYYALTVGPDAR